MGLVEVLSSLGKLIELFNQSVEKIDQLKPDLVIVIDSPDFNLRLIKKLNRRYPVFYYVSPQIWAWREGRINQIKKYVDTMVVLFEFERDYYKAKGVEAVYFGHPLLDMITPQAASKKNIITFMPGSRRSEIKRHMPLIVKTENLLAQKIDYQFQIIRPHNIEEEFYRQFTRDIKIVLRDNKIIEESKFILCASGTATLELAIFNIPHLIFYKVSQVTWAIARLLVKVKFAGIINIICGKKIVEEFLQENATAEKLAGYTTLMLQDEQKYNELKDNLNAACKRLEPHGAIQKFAEYIKTYK
jgi:lipid-A-disaccharide synthase